MRRINPKERARSRVLTDEELHAVWKVAEVSGAYGALGRLLLTTAQRREKIVSIAGATSRWTGHGRSQPRRAKKATRVSYRCLRSRSTLSARSRKSAITPSSWLVAAAVLAIYGATGGEGKDIAHDFSRKSKTKYNEARTDKRCNVVIVGDVRFMVDHGMFMIDVPRRGCARA
jgi:hypothetical protein